MATLLCLTAAALTASVALPQPSFTLAWTHSIEKIRWEEDYRIVDQRLELIEARIRGSGAGMEPPEGAVLKNGVWHYRPELPPLPALRLTRSPFAGDYTLCRQGRCQSMAAFLGPANKITTVDVRPCDAK